ncbi:hypothetical protein AERO8C_120050 [Aeromonas veronii]|uniref:Uncharacterized protein n=1 Tax=Aeromonas veronii TaxID=654 RepID=A0A653KRN2_AERVE|nr:hypothetical protein AERO8C_120050 [Aeromonas veronii]
MYQLILYWYKSSLYERQAFA